MKHSSASPVTARTHTVDRKTTQSHPAMFALISPHCSIMPIEAGMKNIVMFLVRKSAVVLMSSSFIILQSSAMNSSTMPHTLPGMKLPMHHEQILPSARKSNIMKIPFIVFILCPFLRPVPFTGGKYIAIFYIRYIFFIVSCFWHVRNHGDFCMFAATCASAVLLNPYGGCNGLIREALCVLYWNLMLSRYETLF